MIKNKKLFGLFNVLDFIVVIFIITVISGTVYKFNVPGMSNNEGNLTYTVTITNVRDFTVEYYKQGLKCFDSKTGELVGTIKAVRSEPFYEVFVCSDGSIKLSAVPEAVKIELDIETEGVKTDQGYFSRGVYELKVGSELPLFTKYMEVTSHITNIGDDV